MPEVLTCCPTPVSAPRNIPVSPPEGISFQKRLSWWWLIEVRVCIKTHRSVSGSIFVAGKLESQEWWWVATTRNLSVSCKTWDLLSFMISILVGLYQGHERDGANDLGAYEKRQFGETNALSQYSFLPLWESLLVFSAVSTAALHYLCFAFSNPSFTKCCCLLAQITPCSFLSLLLHSWSQVLSHYCSYQWMEATMNQHHQASKSLASVHGERSLNQHWTTCGT